MQNSIPAIAAGPIRTSVLPVYRAECRQTFVTIWSVSTSWRTGQKRYRCRKVGADRENWSPTFVIASLKTATHSPNVRLVATIAGAVVEASRQVKEQGDTVGRAGSRDWPRSSGLSAEGLCQPGLSSTNDEGPLTASVQLRRRRAARSS